MRKLLCQRARHEGAQAFAAGMGRAGGQRLCPVAQALRQTADRHQAKTSRDPNEVALVVAKALEAKRPRFRYQVGFFAKLDYFPARQDADAAHLQVHHALSRPAAGKVITGRSAHLRASKTSFASLMRQAR